MPIDTLLLAIAAVISIAAIGFLLLFLLRRSQNSDDTPDRPRLRPAQVRKTNLQLKLSSGSQLNGLYVVE